jgi:C_GCAxxG_C_C family probable redox protein
LQKLYGLSDAEDSSAAMVLNGGVAYSGGVCGAISGAAMAVGRLAEQRIGDHKVAKRTARRIIQKVMAEFDSNFGSHNCSGLIEYDISTQEGHDEFIESGVWRTSCMSQLEFSVGRLAKLADPEEWDRVVAALDD